jgi:signal transduction histidine kinase
VRAANLPNPEVAELKALKKKIDIEFLQKDIKSLLRESREGLERVKKIVLDLKNFSRSESDEIWQWADIHVGLESTLTIVWNELKHKCEVKKEFGTLPQVYCLPSQINQVFMNLLVNAAQAIQTRGVITIRTGSADNQVWIEISDTGSGIPADILPRIFDPFFTTKPIGSGTGLGLPVSYGIIEHHHGKIEVNSEVGKGSTFRVILPVQQEKTQ